MSDSKPLDMGESLDMDPPPAYTESEPVLAPAVSSYPPIPDSFNIARQSFWRGSYAIVRDAPRP